jgi:hypothetical protein
MATIKPKKYADYVSTLEVPVKPGMMKMRHIAVCDATVLPSAPWHLEAITWTGLGSSHIPGVPQLDITEEKKREMANSPGNINYAFGIEPKGNYPMYHTFDEIFMFVGTNPQDPLDLGGEVEFWMGAGEDAEKYIFDQSTYIYIPAGMVHCPIECTKFVRPFIEFVVVPKPIHTEHRINLWPPDYKPRKTSL